MAMSPRKIGEGLYQPLAEINVTPLVDVMLVLLIIFMVTAPMLATGIKVNLPSARTATPLEAKDPVVVVVAKDGAVSVGKDPVSRDELAAKVKEQAWRLQRRRPVARRPRGVLRRRRLGDGRACGERRDPHRHRLERAPLRQPARTRRRSHDRRDAGWARLRTADSPARLAPPGRRRDRSSRSTPPRSRCCAIWRRSRPSRRGK